MGCCQSTTATRATAAGSITVAPATDAPVLLTEIPALTGAPAQDAKEAGVPETNEETQEAKPEVKPVAEDAKQEVQHGAEELKQEVQHGAEELKEEVQQVVEEVKQEAQETAEELKEEAQHVAEELQKEVVADVAAGVKALSWFKDRFESIVADEAGAVRKEELATKLRETNQVDGQSIGELVGLAGFNSSWAVFEQLDTSKDGFVSWEEFKAHVCGEKEVNEEVDVLLETTVVTQRCWGCC